MGEQADRLGPLIELAIGTPPDDRKLVCYISEPMSHIPYFNYPAFEQAATDLRLAGWFVYSPRENDGDMVPRADGDPTKVKDFDIRETFKVDLWQVCDSDAVFVLPGWERSKGACLEVHTARVVGVPVYTYPDGKIVNEDEVVPVVPPGHVIYVEPPQTLEEAVTLNFGDEWRQTDPVTGGTKGRKEASFANIPAYAQIQEARVHGFGIKKYPDELGAPNWTRGMPWSWFYDALHRHILSFWGGESINPESGLHHLAHARWMLASLMEYDHLGLGTDDRPRWGR